FPGRVARFADKVQTATRTMDTEVDVPNPSLTLIPGMYAEVGYVKTINVDIGDRVRDGQLLATLEIPEMQDEMAKAAATVQQADAEVATASDEIRRANSAHDLARLSYNRIMSVAQKEPGLVPQQQVDEYQSRDQVTEAQVAAAKSSLLAAKQRASVARAEEARLKTLYKYTAITAPFTGVVTKRYANTGAMIQAGTASQSQAMPVVRLSQNNLLRLILPVPESSVPLVHLGQAVDVRVPSLNKTFPGRVARFADKVQTATRTMDTEVDVPNPSLTLIPGMYAEVDLRVAERNNVLSVALDALDRSAGSPRVFAVRSPDVIRILPVGTGLETAQRVEIVSGLSDGDLVVLGRRAGLKEGDKVQPKISDGK
ncbi:MAG: efflux RND transporter periplasmic adaptor subunit, partial [Acidobacteria bacterium]|nr:efflux RND transporter periplasmic adaptor subunit [Acidobacteriota bacterium]